MATSEMSASSGLIHSIMISNADDREHRPDDLGEALLERRRDVVDVVRDPSRARRRAACRRRTAAAGARACGRRPRRAAGTSSACAMPAMRYCCPHGERRADQVDRASVSRIRPDTRVVRRPRRVELHPGEHLGQLVLALRAEPGDHLLLRRAGRELLVDDALEQHVRRVAEELGSDDREDELRAPRTTTAASIGAFAPEAPGQSGCGAAEVLRLRRRRHHGRMEEPASAGTGRRGLRATVPGGSCGFLRRGAAK